MENLKNKRDWTISEIESLTEAQAQELAEESTEIKGYNVYFITFPEYFGYSACVYKNNHHIHYVNDYELHHHYMVKESGLEWKEKLHQYYIDSILNKVFTDDEIAETLKDYDEYEKKIHFLHNYHIMEIDHLSGFYIGKDQKEEIDRKIKENQMIYNPYSWCYILPENKDYIEKERELLEKLEERKAEMSDNFEYYKKAFLHEMYNHEYGIAFDPDFETLQAFVKYTSDINANMNLEQMFNALQFTENQKKAYKAAQKEYRKNAEY